LEPSFLPSLWDKDHCRVWVEFARSLLRADAAHMVRLNRSSRKILRLDAKNFSLISLLFSLSGRSIPSELERAMRTEMYD
jgi:hypothetical protein